MEDLFSFLTELVNNPLHLLRKRRFILLLISCIFSIAFYHYVVGFYTLGSDLTRILPWDKNEPINFYSGGRGGTYFEVGQALEKSTSGKIINDTTSGGYENAQKTLTKEHSFGLAQNQAFPPNDAIRSYLNFITPLYNEHFQVIARTSDPTIRISAHMNKSSLEFFRNCTVNTGPQGSGTKLLASIILEDIDTQIRAYLPRHTSFDRFKKLTNLTHKEAFKRLRDDSRFVQFIMMGFPNESVQRVLDSVPGTRLIEIDPSFTAKLKKEFPEMDIRPSTVKYDTTVSSFSSPCYIITRNGTSYFETEQILSYLKDKNILRDSAKVAPSEIYEYKEIFEEKNKDKFYVTLKNLLLFISSVVLTTIPTYLFFVWLTSGFTRGRYVKALNEIALVSIPDVSIPSMSREVSDKDKRDLVKINRLKIENTRPNQLRKPYIRSNQMEVINDIIDGQSKLVLMRTDLNREHTEHHLVEQHFTFLTGRVDQIMEKLRHSLGIRLHEVFVANPGKYEYFKDLIFTQKIKILNELFTSNYLLKETYEFLQEKLASLERYHEQHPPRQKRILPRHRPHPFRRPGNR